MKSLKLIVPITVLLLAATASADDRRLRSIERGHDLLGTHDQSVVLNRDTRDTTAVLPSLALETGVTYKIVRILSERRTMSGQPEAQISTATGHRVGTTADPTIVAFGRRACFVPDGTTYTQTRCSS